MVIAVALFREAGLGALSPLANAGGESRSVRGTSGIPSSQSSCAPPLGFGPCRRRTPSNICEATGDSEVSWRLRARDVLARMEAMKAWPNENPVADAAA